MQRSYKYLDIITVVFVVVLLLADLVASVKVTQLLIPAPENLLGLLASWGLPVIGSCLAISFTTGLFFFPVSYLAGDILTEVYGYDKSRRVIWTGFISLIIANIIIKILVSLPPDPHWTLQPAYEQIFALSMRISAASMFAYFCGEFVNSYTVAKLKVLTQGKNLALRLIGSTMTGELVDTLIFYPLAFIGMQGFPTDLIIKIMITNYIVKVMWEVIAYPATRQLVLFLKHKENEDYYDYKTNFSPFHLQN